MVVCDTRARSKGRDVNEMWPHSEPLSILGNSVDVKSISRTGLVCASLSARTSCALALSPILAGPFLLRLARLVPTRHLVEPRGGISLHARGRRDDV